VRAPAAAALLSILIATPACSRAEPAASTASTATTTPIATTAPQPITTTPPAPAATPPTSAPTIVDVTYRIERHTVDPETAGFEAVVQATLSDRRGWSRAGFVIDNRPTAAFLVVLAEADEAQVRCLPYDVYRKYSCQNGPEVVLNADRWRYATPEWTGDLSTYRVMLVNHEFGHLLGMHHPSVQCPRPGQPAPIMSQQSTELNGCVPNPWPLDDEIARAARHDLPLAPPYTR
jgi:hypothetical protein